MKKSSLTIYLVFFLISFCSAQNIFDFNSTIKFANFLYNNKNYSGAINEFMRAWNLKDLSVDSQIKLFQSYLFSKNPTEGIKLYKTKNPTLLTDNDTIEVIYGKLLISAKQYEDIFWLVENSQTLTKEQSLYLSISSELLAGNWNQTNIRMNELSGNLTLKPFESIFNDIENVKYKSPLLSLSLSSVVPGLGKVYSGYWKDGLVSFLAISIAAWQTYRGFDKYGPSRAYGWIYASLSTTLYFGNLYGSFKSANKKNYILKNSILNKVEETYSKMFCF